MECIVDIKNWMTSHFLLLNSEKTEVLIIGPKTPTSNNLEHCLTLDGCSVNYSSSVRNLGVLFNSNLSFDSHVSSICKTAFFHLKNISKLRPMLSMSNAEILIHAFMTSRLDYCNALVGGVISRERCAWGSGNPGTRQPTGGLGRAPAGRPNRARNQRTPNSHASSAG